MDKAICVYSSSSCEIAEEYFDVALELGRLIARKGYSFIFGGGLIGLMGTCAKGVHECGGKVIGVIPEALNRKGIVYEAADEIIVTEGMRERKAVMDTLSSAFIALPGGFGTLEELLEIITLRQLGYHDKLVVIVNTRGFYDHLIGQFERGFTEKFAVGANRSLYHVVSNAGEAMEYIDTCLRCQRK